MLNLITKTFKSPFLFKACLSRNVLRPFSSYSLALTKSTTPATIERKPNALLIQQWWSQSPFDQNKPLAVPVFSFHTGEFVGENVELDHSIFNVPLRRDIVHTVYQWRINLGKKTTHVAKTKGTVAGSGKKPFRQKGTGRARQGNLRAPGRKKGGKAHGPVPRDYTYEIPRKIRLQALKVMLSAKLAEGHIRIVDTEKVDAPKTKLVAEALKQFDSKYRILLVTSYDTDENFKIASKNIQRIDFARPHSLNILKLLKCDKLLITKEGLEQLIQNFKDRTEIRYRVGPRYNREITQSETQRIEAFNLKRKQAEIVEYDPNKPLKLKFRILQDYLKDYEEKRTNDK